MIGKLSGRIDYRALDHLLLDVRGVGYIVYVSDRVMATLPSDGEAISLYTDLLVREDNLQLFGFSSLIEKEWHRLLMSVQGIGAKASLAILGTLGSDGVSQAIALGDFSAISKAKGVGPKTAKKVILDLKDKAPAVMAMSAAPSLSPTDQTAHGADPADDAPLIETQPIAPKPTQASNHAAQAEALSALSNLGYAQSDAVTAIAQTLRDTPNLGTTELIREALKSLAPKP